MTTISSAPITATRAAATSAEAGTPDGATTDPNDLVGTGSGSARWLGGIAGAGVGIGAMVGLTALTGRSGAMPIRIAGAVGGLAAIGGGAFMGQKLLGNATRATSAETDRAAAAQVEARSIDFRATEAMYRGRIDEDQLEQVHQLRDERTKLAEAGPDQGFIARWGMPVAVGIGAAALAGFLAMKYSPDDGKGITAMFNTMFAVPAGGAAGAWAGSVLGDATMPGTRFSEVPAASAERIAAIDAELDELLGPDAA